MAEPPPEAGHTPPGERVQALGAAWRNSLHATRNLPEAMRLMVTANKTLEFQDQKLTAVAACFALNHP